MQELDHTSATLAAMDASHERLAKSKDEYEKQTPLLSKSRRLLSRMSWHSILDNLVLYGCLAIFFAVVAYIVYKRLIYFVPSFLIPSFLGQSPGTGQQLGNSPARLQPGRAPPGSTLSPSVGGPPSNDRWYEAQPGFDEKDRISDDRWYEAQADDTPRPEVHAQPPQPHVHPQQASSQQADVSTTQQQQRQLEEAYREAVPQPISPPAGSAQDSLLSAQPGPAVDAVPSQGLPAAHLPQEEELSASQAASEVIGASQSRPDMDPLPGSGQAELGDSSMQIPEPPMDVTRQQTSSSFSEDGSAEQDRLSKQGKAVPGVGMPPAPFRAAVPPPPASQAELDIRKGLGSASIPQPSEPHAEGAARDQQASAVQSDELSERSETHTDLSDSLDVVVNATEGRLSTSEGLQGSGHDDASLEHARDAHSAEAGRPIHAAQTAASPQADDLEMYPGLEKVDYPEALQVTEPAAADNSSIESVAAHDVSLPEGGPLPEAAASTGNPKPGSADDGMLEPATPTQKEGARRSETDFNDSASEEGELESDSEDLRLLEEPPLASADSAELGSARQPGQESHADLAFTAGSASLNPSGLDADQDHHGKVTQMQMSLKPAWPLGVLSQGGLFVSVYPHRLHISLTLQKPAA